MNDFLEKVMKERVADAAAAAHATPPTYSGQGRAEGRKKRSLSERLASGGSMASIIAEVKKASPSAGLIRADYHPEVIAAEYERCGAVGISVLTEPRYFLGSDDHLRAVREAVDLPILRKDFIGDLRQVHESARLGADVILLICAALDFALVKELNQAALSAGLEVLVETHTRAELEQALELEDAIIGVNSRNLKTLKTDLAVAKELAAAIPPGRLSVAESGIRNRRDIEELQAVGYKGFLIGESLMKSDDIVSAFSGLRCGVRRLTQMGKI